MRTFALSRSFGSTRFGIAEFFAASKNVVHEDVNAAQR
jgi:hypothetical protein